MRRIRNRVDGLDVHRDSVTGCVECFDGVDVEVTKQRFSTTTAKGIRELADWLATFEVLVKDRGDGQVANPPDNDVEPAAISGAADGGHGHLGDLLRQSSRDGGRALRNERLADPATLRRFGGVFVVAWSGRL